MFDSLIVVDTSTIIEGLLSNDKSPAFQILYLAQTKEFQLATCKETIAELKQTITKAAIKDRAKPKIFTRFIPWYQYNSYDYQIAGISGLCRDPNDDKFLELASVSGASFLVTKDKDMLSLKTIQDCKIVTSLEFLEMYKG